jgi:protein-S-isoprenylcysteine O-methyltransferase Ste14
MFEAILIAAFPVLFLAVLAGGGAALRRRNIDMEGVPPIKKSLFLLSKLAMLVPWAAMFLQALGVNLSPVRVPPILKGISLGLWAAGFGLSLAGCIGLGSSFRVGCPKDETTLRTDGIFRCSRNPIYLGLDTTFLAAALFTLNPAVLVVGAGIAAVHHRIILAEEECLRKTHGQAYAEYCRRVGRYL